MNIGTTYTEYIHHNIWFRFQNIYVVELLFQIYIFQQHFNNTDDTYTSYGEVTGKNLYNTIFFTSQVPLEQK